MKIYRFLIITFFIVLSQTKAFSQTGELVVRWDFEYYFDTTKADFLVISLYQNDTLEDIYSSVLSEEKSIRKVNPGVYKLIIETSDSTQQIINNIRIESNRETIIIITIPEIYSLKISDSPFVDEIDTSLENVYINSLHYLNGNNFINKNDNFNAYYEFGYKQGVLIPATKYISFGYLLGSSFNNAFITKSSTLSNNPNVDTEKYLYWSFTSTLITRIKTFNYTKYNHFGPYIDLGINYNLPIMFRYVETDGNTRSATKRLHNFNDFSAIGRFGYAALALTIDYRLTHFIKDPFPELPKFKIGISIVMDLDD